MVTIDKSVLKILSMSLLDIKTLNALPKVERKKALKTIESYQRFMAVVEQLMAIDYWVIPISKSQLNAQAHQV